MSTEHAQTRHARTTPAATASTRVAVSRYAVLLLSMLFAGGALAQFFLAGLAVFDDPTRWPDHASLGHALGIVAMLIWIPALFGRVGRRMVAATIALAVLFEAQYGFVNAGIGTVRALHAVNGVVMFWLATWIVRNAIGLVGRSATQGDNP